MAETGVDEEVLKTLLTRKPVLAALAEGPHHRRDLEEKLDLSKTTCHRIVRSFDEKGLLRRTDRGYELTTLGGAIEAQVDQFDTNVRTLYRLEQLVAAFESTDVDFDVELFADATITRADPDDPSSPLSRSLELFRGSNTIRVVEGTEYIPPLYVEKAFEICIENEMTGEFICSPAVAKKRVSEFTDLHRRISEEPAQLRYRIHDDVPFGMTLHDDHVELRAYDDDTGSVVLMVDTDDPDAIAWAEDVYEQYWQRAVSPSSLDEFPDWLPDPDIEF